MLINGNPIIPSNVLSHLPSIKKIGGMADEPIGFDM
jgi:hypothetical protein